MDSYFVFKFLYQHNYIPLEVNVLQFLMMVHIMMSSDNDNDVIENDHDGVQTDFGGWEVWSVYDCISACRQSLKMDCLVNDRARFT